MTPKRIGFRVKNVYKVKKPRMLAVARQKISFIVASMSLFAFVMGNMVGQHGWYAFWKTVMGAEDDSLIVFVGMVPPVEKVPDYTKWYAYGGGDSEHTYRQVPKDLLVPLPAYDAAALRVRGGESLAEAVYSVGNLGSYETGADHGGSHVGVDIRVPLGTPIVSIANGTVTKVSMVEYGYGHHVVIRHPNVPDPKNPGKTMTIHSVYAHLDTILPMEGQVVHKGEQIATSGSTGFASGPHLHFQIDHDDAPYHPYWPFTTAEANEARLSFNQAINRGLHQERGEQYTLSPLLLVQRYQGAVQSTVAAAAGVKAQTAVSRPLTPREKLKLAREQRVAARLARAGTTARPVVTTVATGGARPEPESSSSSSVSSVSSSVMSSVSSSTTATSTAAIDRVEIRHSGKLSFSWQKVQIVAVDREGATVTTPTFAGRLYVIPEFGEAEIRPSELAPADFINGVATVNVLARGNKTVFIGTRGAFDTMSAAMVADR